MGQYKEGCWKEALLSKPAQTHVAVGNINIDISVEVDNYPGEDTTTFATKAWIGPGGAATNYAVAVAKLGHRSILVARAGEDLVKLGILDDLKRQGVITSYIQVAKGESPGIVVVIVSPKRSTRTMISVRGANEGITGSIIPSIGNVVHFASVKGRVIEEGFFSIKGRIVTYDPGGEVYRDPRSIINILRKKIIKILYINDRELDALLKSTNTTINELFEKGLEILVIKKGRGGAIAVTPDNKVEMDSPKIATPVDVTGAGDAFDAAFNIAIVHGCSIGESLKLAIAAGAAKVMKRGSSNMPSSDEIIKIINNYI